MMESVVKSSWCAAFSRRADGRIAAWNRAAESLFAVPARSVVGRPCFEVLGGRDVHGNDYCCAECASWRMAVVDRPVCPFTLRVRVEESRGLDVRVSVLVSWRSDGPTLVHLLEPVLPTGPGGVCHEEPDRSGGTWGGRAATLTARELQVLRHLAVGGGTDDIASHLLISRATARNHIASCLRKLEVHSRAEAVGLAHRLNLV